MKMAFWIVFVAGLAACAAFGIGPVLKRMGGSWTSVPMLLGIALGVAIVALAVAFVAGFRPAFLATDAVMVGVLVALIAAKVLVGAAAMTGVLGKG